MRTPEETASYYKQHGLKIDLMDLAAIIRERGNRRETQRRARKAEQKKRREERERYTKDGRGRDSRKA